MRKALVGSLISLLLLSLVLTAYAEEKKPKPPSKVKIKKAIREYIAADAQKREEMCGFFESVPPLKKRDIKKWRKAIKEILVKQVEQEVKGLNEKHFKKFAKSGVFFVEGGALKMKYVFRAGGKKGKKGYPMYINLHGGGASKATNDNQWGLAQGHYGVRGRLFVPRAPKDEVLSWAIPEMVELLNRALKESFLLREIDPDNVYILGYSMGGWGTLLLGPAMADRWAAVGSSAGGEHIRRANPENLRNTPIIIQIGTEDHSAGRYKLTSAYAARLKELHESDEDGYTFLYKEHKGAGHQISDSDTPKWLSQHTRDPFPKKVVWKPVMVPGWNTNAFYYVKVDNPSRSTHIVVTREGNTFTIEEAQGASNLTLLLNDQFVDLDKPVIVMQDGQEVFKGKVERSLLTLIDTYIEKADDRLSFTAEIKVGD